MGDNFSVHDTKVIAGGVCIPNIQLISRELMRVTIPSCVNTVTLCENGKNNKYVAIYVATPYGITNHLHVPVMPDNTPLTISEDLKKEIEKQVSKDVTKTINSLDLMTKPARVTAADNTNKVVKVNAEILPPTGNTGASMKLRESDVTNSRVQYKALFDPRFENAIIYGAVRDDKQYYTRLIPFGTLKSAGTQEFPALGPVSPESPNPNLLRELETTLNSKGIFPAANKPLKLRTVYFAAFDGQPPKVPLAEEIEMEISLLSTNGGSNSTAATPAEEVPTPAADNATSRLRFSPTPVTTDCGCQFASTCGVQPAAFQVASRSPLPVQFAQLETPATDRRRGIRLGLLLSSD